MLELHYTSLLENLYKIANDYKSRNLQNKKSNFFL